MEPDVAGRAVDPDEAEWETVELPEERTAVPVDDERTALPEADAVELRVTGRTELVEAERTDAERTVLAELLRVAVPPEDRVAPTLETEEERVAPTKLPARLVPLTRVPSPETTLRP